MDRLQTKPVGAFVVRDTGKAFAALTVVSVQRRGNFEVWHQLIHDKQGPEGTGFKLLSSTKIFQTLESLLQHSKEPKYSQQQKNACPVPLRSYQ